MKTSAVIECTFSNSSETKFGIYHYHRLKFENGDFGNIGTKEVNPEKISVGKVLTYEITGDKIKLITAQQPMQTIQQPIQQVQQPIQQPTPTKTYTKTGYTKKPEEFIGYVLGYAKDIVCAKIVAKQKLTNEAEEVNKIADAIYEQVKKMLQNS